MTIHIDGLELDWLGRDDVLPSLIFRQVGTKRRDEFVLMLRPDGEGQVGVILLEQGIEVTY